MKQLITLIILLIVLACDDEGGNSSNVGRSTPNEQIPLDFTLDNVLDIWRYNFKIRQIYVSDTILVSVDTTNYDYILDMSGESVLYWNGKVFYNWDIDGKKATVSGDGEGTWFFTEEANLVDTTYIVKIYMNDVYRWTESDWTERLDIVGFINALTNYDMKLVQYGMILENQTYTDTYYFKRSVTEIHS